MTPKLSDRITDVRGRQWPTLQRHSLPHIDCREAAACAGLLRPAKAICAGVAPPQPPLACTSVATSPSAWCHLAIASSGSARPARRRRIARASRAALADTIQHQAIQVGVQVGHRHRSRNQDDHGAVGLAGLEAGPLDQKPGQHPLRDLQNRREQRGLRRRPPPNLDRQRSLACWHMRSDVVDQV